MGLRYDLTGSVLSAPDVSMLRRDAPEAHATLPTRGASPRRRPSACARSLLRLLVCAAVVALLGAPALADARGARAATAIGTVQRCRLPDEARRTIELVLRGGPFPHRRDGVVFENREGRLPSRPRGHYLEYTVPTPGRRDRGARRLVVGGGKEFYYTSDHYRSFRRVEGVP